MKRSEMVALIELEVNNRLADAYSYWDERIASDFLSILEKVGMCPPGYSGLQANGKKYNADTDSGRDVMWVRGKWEPEDG